MCLVGHGSKKKGSGLVKRTWWSETVKDEICKLYANGDSCKIVSEKTGVPFRTVHKYLVDRGIVRRRSGVPVGHKFSAERNARLSESRKGVRLSEETKAKMSLAHRCYYDGLNGYGHTKKTKNGYVLTYCPCHPNAHSDGYVFLHTVIVERELGRYLNENEVAHHINHVRDDNRPENLMLMDRKEHMSIHMKERHEKERKQ